MKTEKLKPIKLHGSDVEKLFVTEEDFHDDGKPKNKSKSVKGFENWYITADEQSGEFDSAKSAMVDFEMDLYDDKGEFRGSTNGGYYVQGEYSFDFSSTHFYIFNPPKPETPESKFDKFLSDVSDEDIPVKKKIAKIVKYIKEFET